MRQKNDSSDGSVHRFQAEDFEGMALVSNGIQKMSPRRTGYPLSSCTSDELDCVFTGNSMVSVANGNHIS